MNPDFVERGTLRQIRKALGFHLKIGWNETATDTALVSEILPMSNGKEPQYEAKIWNRPGVRAELSALLGLPVHYSDCHSSLEE